MGSSRTDGSPFKPPVKRGPSNLSQRSDGDRHAVAAVASTSTIADDDDPLAGLQMVPQGSSSSSSSSSGERIMTVDQLEVSGRCQRLRGSGAMARASIMICHGSRRCRRCCWLQEVHAAPAGRCNRAAVFRA